MSAKSTSISATVTFTLTFALLLHPHPASSLPSENRCVKVSAAFSYDGNIYLVIGDRLVSLDGSLNIVDTMETEELEFPHEVTAAVGLGAYGEFYLYSGITQQAYVGFGWKTGDSLVDSRYLQKALRDETDGRFHGLDAAMASPGNKIWYFSRCRFLVMPAYGGPDQTGQVADNSVVGLPCHVDAAVYSPVRDELLVIKGDDVWTLSRNGDAFLGPVKIGQFIRALRRYNFCSA